MAAPHGRSYVLTWIGLLGLTALSFITSVMKPSLVVEAAIALGIATIKATLVALVFMHLLHARFAQRMTIGVAVVLVALLASLMVTDVASRHTMPPKPLPPATRADASAGAPGLGAAQPQKPVAARKDPVIVGAGRTKTLSSNPAPANVDWSTVGRNDPCPCGSGKKFKKCHGANL